MNYNLVYKKVHFISYKNILILFLFFNLSFLYAQDCVDIIPPGSSSAYIPELNITFSISGAAGDSTSDALLNSIAIAGHPNPYAEVWPANSVSYNFANPAAANQYVLNNTVLGANISQGAVIFDPDLLGTYSRNLRNYVALDNAITVGDYIDYSFNVPFLSAINRYIVITDADGDHASQIQALDASGNPMAMSATTIPGVTYIDSGYLTDNGENIFITVFPITALANSGTPIHGLRYNPLDTAGDGPNGKVFVMYDVNTQVCIEAQDDVITSTLIVPGGTTPSIYEDHGNGIDNVNDVIASPFSISTNIDIIDNGGLTGATINNSGVITIPPNTSPGLYLLEYEICLGFYSSVCDQATAIILVQLDTDSDGIPDADDGFTGGNGISVSTDIDDDNDGITDFEEMKCNQVNLGNSNNGLTGAYRDNIFWLNWTGDFANGIHVGDSQTFTLPDGATITATVTNAVATNGATSDYVPVDMNTEASSLLKDYYNSPGTSEAFYNSAVDGVDLDVTFEFTATYNGLTYLPDLVLADAENTNPYMPNLESLIFTTNGRVWEELDHIPKADTQNSNNVISTSTEGITAAGNGYYVYRSKDATRIEVSSQTVTNKQGFAIGIWLECLPLDFDGDNYPNHLDLDSDGDGIYDIVEAGNGAHDIDVPFHNYASDKDGRTDSNVGSNGLDNGLETNDSYYNAVINYVLPNTDGNGGYNYLDIDSDNDGIVDNIEGQPSNAYVAPSTNDNNHNGVDDAYDNAFTWIDPENTDGADLPDYMDTNADNDDHTDAIEGWDTTNDGIANTNPSGNDTDGDGLDDNYDNDNTQINPTNGQTPASFPNLDNHLTPELDWREVVVTTISVEKTGIWNDVNSDGLADAGETVLYTIEIENTGNSPLFNFQFADPGVTVITGLPIPNLIAGATHTVLVRQTITQAAVDAGEISNQATVTYTAPTITNVTPLGYVYTNDSDDPNDNTDNDNADTDPEDDPDDITIIDLPQDSSMNVEKTDVSNDVNSNGQMDPGDTITYTIVITNTSNTTLNGITITDPLLGVVNQPIGSGSIAPNSSETVTLVYTLVQADIDNGIVTNQATVNYVDYSGTTYTNGSDDPDDNTDNDNADTETDADPDDPTPTDIIQVNNISVIKTDTYDDANSNGLADPGETINYVITITNTGNTTLTNVVIDDALLAMANVQVGSGTLSAGQVVVINGSYTLLQADIDSGTVTNQATVTYTDIDGVISTNDSDDPDENADVDSNDTEPNTDPDDPTVTDIIQDNSISVIKTDAVVDVDTNGLINIGDRIDYTIQITNIGNTTINNVTITDSLLGITNQQVGTGTLISGAVETVTGSYILTQADVDSGSVSNQALVNYTDNDGNSFTNASDDPDELANLDNSDTEPNNDPDDPTVTEIIKDNSITVTKTDTYVDTNTNGFIDVGDTINYTIIVTHTGNVTLSLVLVTDVLVGVNNELINIGGIILPEDVETINYSYIITQADINTGQVSNQATIRYDDVDAIRLTNDSDDPDDNSDNDNADTETNNDPDDPTITDIPQINLLTVTKTDAYVDTNFNGVLDAGDTIEYTIIVTNTGNVPLTNVSLDDALVGIINQQVGTGTLNPTDSETITLSYTLVQADIDAETLSNQATITYTDFDGNVLTNDSDDPDDNSENDNTDTEPNTDPDDPTVTDIIRIDALSVIKTDVFNDVNSNGFIDVGETIDYTIVVSNTGNMTQTNISITDALLNITNQVVGTGILAPNTSETLNYTYTLTQTDIDAGEVSNQATVTYTDSDTNIQTNDSDDPDDNSENDNADSEPANDADDPTVTDIPHNDRITVTKTDSYNDVNANGVMDSGDTIDYIIIVTNIGNTTLTNVTLTDTLLAINNQAVGTGTMIPSDTETITGTYTLLQVDIDAGSVSNQATISFTDPNNNSYTNDSDDPDDINENDNADTEEHNDQDDPTVTDIIQNNTMTVTKTDNYVDTNSNGVMDIGDHIGYTIIVSNIGNTTLSNVTITDTLLGVNNQQVGTGTLLPTAVETLNYNYPITQADIDAGQVNNQASISYNIPSGTTFTNNSDDPDDVADLDNGDTEPNSDPDDPTITDIIQVDVITVTKTDVYNDINSNGVMDTGDTIAYTIIVTNTGNTSLSNITITDSLLGVNNQQVGTGTLLPTAVETLNYNYPITQADIDAGQISNQATISYSNPNGTSFTNDSDDPDDSSEIDNTDSEPNSDPDDPTVTDIIQIDSITVIKTDNYIDTDSNGLISIDDTLTYTITITNTGNTTLSGVTLTDALLSINNQLISNALAPNNIETNTYNYTLIQADIDAGTVSNQAVISYTDPENNTYTNDSDDPDDASEIDNTDSEPNADPDDPTVTDIPHTDQITVIKTDNYVDTNLNGIMDAGDTIEYTITITNIGNTTLSNIEITDPLLGINNQQVGTGVILPNLTETLNYNYTITQADVDAENVSNQATVSYTNLDGNAFTNDSDDPDDNADNDNTDTEPNTDPDDPTDTEIIRIDALSIVKTDTYVDVNTNGLMDAGDRIDYTIIITNVGSSTLTNISITDALVNVTNQQVGTGIFAPEDTETLNYNYTLLQTDIDAGLVNNQATVTYTDPNNNTYTNDSDDPDDITNIDNTDTEPNDDFDDPTVTDIIQIDRITVVKTDTYVDVNANGLMDVGDQINYAIVVTNTGNTTLTSVSITDALVTVNNQQVGTGTLLPNAVENLNYTYTLLQADIDSGNVSNQATISYSDPNNNTYTNDSDDPDDNTENDTNDTEEFDDADDPTVTDIIQIDRIIVVKTDTYVDVNANGLMDVGDQINYAIVVTNTGNTTLTSVSITDALVTVNNQQVGTGTLVPNAIENLNYTYTLLQADIDSGSVSNQATISYSDPNNNTYTNDSDDPDDNTENDTNDTEEFNDADDPTVTDIIHVDRMTVEKTGVWIDANINTLANVGEIVQYQIVIINTGNTTLTGIQFTDSDVVVISGLPILDLAPTNTQTVVVEQPITQQDIDNGSISNQATITYGTPLNGSFTNLSDDPTDNTDNDAADTEIYNDADDITVIQLPVIDQITVTKTGSWVDGNNSGFAEIGETVIYQIILENIGTTTLSNIQFTDANVSVVFGLPIPDLSPSNTHMLIVEQAINQTDIDNSFASNQATITYNNPIGGVFTNNSDDPTNLADVDNADTEPHNDADDITIVPLDINSQMTVTKTGVWNDADADGFADAGEIVQYEIIITNIGATTLSNVQFTDTNVTVISGLPIADLASGDVRTVIVEHVLTQQDVNNAITSNQAIITYDTPFGNTFTNASDDPSDNADIDNADTENHNDADDITVIQLDVNSQMTVEKTGAWNDADADGFAEVGEIVSYQVVIENVGTTTLSNVQFADANVTVISGLPLTDLAPTDTQTVVVEHILTQQDIDNGFTTNQAIITYDTPFGNTFTNASDDPSDNADIDNADTENHNDADDITVIQLDVNSQMTVEKTGVWNDADADGFAEVGEIVSYQVVIENVGTTTLSNVQFADANVTVISGLPLTDLAPTDTQTVVVEQVLTQQDIDNGFATNQATITYDTPFGNTFTNASDDPTNLANIDINNDNEPNHDADDVTVIYLPTNSQMTVLKTGVWNDGNANGNADAGEIVQYQIVIENIGTTTLSDIQFADINVTVVSGLPIVDLAPTDMQTVIVDYVLTQQDVDNGFATNQAIITYNTPSNDTYTNASDDPNNASDIDNHDNEPNHDADDVTVVPLLDVSSQMTVIKTGNVVDGNANGIADLGEIIAYQIVITNTGTTTLTNILFDDANANVSNMPIPNLIPGADNSFTVYHILTQVDIDAGFVTNQATVTYQTPSGNTFTNDSDDPTDNTDADTNDSEPDNDPDDPTIVNLSLTSHMTVEKTGTWIDSNTNGLANVGEVILYQIVIKNTSSTTLSNIQFSDANVNIVFGLPIPDLAYNDNHTVVVQHVLTQADIDTGVYNNQATITYQTPNGNTFTNDSDDPTNFADVDNNDSEPDNDPDDITVVDLPIDNKMNVLKTGNLVDANGNGYSDVGEVIQYEIEIINTGNTTLSNLVFTDNGVTIVSGGTIPSLLPTESHIVVVEQLITQQNIDLGAVSNQALVAYDTPLDGSFTNASDDPNNATDLDINDSEPHNDPDDITVIALPINHQLEVLKTGSLIDADGSGHADIGEMVQYQIEITNTGNTTLSNMQFTDAGVTVVSGLPIPDLPSGATHTVIVEEAVGQLDIDAGFVTNQATITYFTPLSGPFTNDSDDPNDPTDVDGNDTEIRDDPDDITIVRLPTDNDSDGVEDSIDLDDDNDGIPDAVEIGNDPSNPIDSDGDTIPDYLDLDSDNDGVYDIDEAGNGQNDANNDGMTDFPVGNNGLDNNLETDDNPSATHNYIVLDSDLDGILNYLDLDSDNDGMTDTNETLGTDLDGDGLVDNFTDANENGVDDYTESNPISVNDTDGDNLPNFLDIDSDGDGIVDNTEFYPTDNFTLPTYNDGNSNGLDNAYDPNSGGTLIIPVDTDGDEIPDYLDLDSDNDDLIDSIEGWDYNADAIPDTVPSNVDADNDGLDDAYDTDTNYPESTNGKDAYDYPNMQNPTTEERDWRESLEIIVYEVFTPNNDGKNDAWHIEGIGYFPNHNVSVYNRWGALVYETNNFDNVVGWSGVANVNGRQGANVILPTGTYFYIIKLGPSYEDRMGYIHIIKED